MDKVRSFAFSFPASSFLRRIKTSCVYCIIYWFSDYVQMLCKTVFYKVLSSIGVGDKLNPQTTFSLQQYHAHTAALTTPLLMLQQIGVFSPVFSQNTPGKVQWRMHTDGKFSSRSRAYFLKLFSKDAHFGLFIRSFY